MQKCKIILNTFPPMLNSYPAASLSVLKGFLSSFNIEVDIIYWNLILNDLVTNTLKKYGIDVRMKNSPIIRLFPFLSIINENCKDHDGRNKLIMRLIDFNINKKYINNSLYSKIYDNIVAQTHSIIDNKLKKLDLTNSILFGISTKFYQWIPGSLLAEKLVKKNPNIKTVVGGFGNKDEAIYLLKLCNHFDFAIIGEGEYPLLKLYNVLSGIENLNKLTDIERLIFRDQNNNIKANNCDVKEYHDFNNYSFPNYDDYFSQIKQIKDITFDKNITFSPSSDIYLTINSARGCFWNKCKFCYLNNGYKYRIRSPESIINEIKYFSRKYNIYSFIFVDNDIIGSNKERFMKLLDSLIELSANSEKKYKFTGDILHTNLDSTIIGKLAISGFNIIQIGYESNSDRCLTKISKRTNFSDNICTIKFALKHKIKVIGSNIIVGIPDEDAEDVLENINNLHFIRFFFPQKKYFKLILTPLAITNSSRYSKSLSETEKERWNYNPLFNLLPAGFFNGLDRFNFFDFVIQGFNSNFYDEWKTYSDVQRYYEHKSYSYTLINNEIPVYEEYLNGKRIKQIKFSTTEYWEVLKAANDSVVSFSGLLKSLRDGINISEDNLKKILFDLKSMYLLYYSDNYNNIISVINTNEITSASNGGNSG